MILSTQSPICCCCWFVFVYAQSESQPGVLLHAHRRLSVSPSCKAGYQMHYLCHYNDNNYVYYYYGGVCVRNNMFVCAQQNAHKKGSLSSKQSIWVEATQRQVWFLSPPPPLMSSTSASNKSHERAREERGLAEECGPFARHITPFAPSVTRRLEYEPRAVYLCKQREPLRDEPWKLPTFSRRRARHPEQHGPEEHQSSRRLHLLRAPAPLVHITLQKFFPMRTRRTRTFSRLQVFFFFFFFSLAFFFSFLSWHLWSCCSFLNLSDFLPGISVPVGSKAWQRAGTDARSREGLSGEWQVDSARPHFKLLSAGQLQLYLILTCAYKYIYIYKWRNTEMLKYIYLMMSCWVITYIYSFLYLFIHLSKHLFICTFIYFLRSNVFI